jgi:type II restriction enzyme
VSIPDKIRDASQILAALGMDSERSNERSALTLVALLHQQPGEPWANAANPMLGTRAIMDWMRDHYDRNYAANTRETIRRFTLHQFADALLVQQNPDQPDRPVNSPKWNYQVTPKALAVIQRYGSPEFGSRVADYLAEVPGLKKQYAAAREMNRIPITLPSGEPFTLSPGGQNVLIKQMVEEFCPQFTPGAEVLYVGDADSKWALFEADRLAALGVTVDQHGKMPDLVVYLPDKDWLVLMEAASSHGPVDAKRHGELAALFKDATPGLVYVSCFPDRKEMRKYLQQIAWETEVWCAEDPTHLIHFNGERFLGPYK